MTAEWPGTAPRVETLAAGRGWVVRSFICQSGPDDAAFEERHDAVTVAAVEAGSFTYHSERGRALMHPGALLLGNRGTCYACSHQHGTGDCCVSAQIEPTLFEEIAASAAQTSGYRFSVSALAGRDQMAPVSVVLAAARHVKEPLAYEAAFMDALASMISALSGAEARAQTVSARDEKRILRVVRYMEKHATAALDLDGLAARAAMSKFHFLRVFRQVTGDPPYRFLLGLRLRLAAMRLLAAPASIADVAFEVGFGDLSTFNSAFRRQFGASPTDFRRRYGWP